MATPADHRASEVGEKADFSRIRYAQCWEDADILLAALDIQPEHQLLSIASAGDNTLSLLTRTPKHVVALDLSAAQLACLALRVAAYRALDHAGLLELLGARPSQRRAELYAACRAHLSVPERAFWDAHPHAIRAGIGNVGKFESYLRLFGRWVLPLLQSGATRRGLLIPRTYAERVEFFDRRWDHGWWRAVFRIFFSRKVMGMLGRDPSFFAYVEGRVGDRLLARVRHALTALDPTENPYLQWILLGRFGTALPHALRPENFAAIRENLDCLAWRCCSIEDYLASNPSARFHGYNLSDIFEYMSPANYRTLLGRLVEHGISGGKLVYWNMMAPRRRPVDMSEQLHPNLALSQTLYAQDKAFFYSDFVIEEIL